MCWLKYISRSAIFFTVLIWFFVLNYPLFAETVDRVVAKVNGKIITLSSVHDRFRVISEKINASGNVNRSQPETELMKNALNSIIEERLQIQEAKKYGFEVSEASLNKAIDEIKKNNNITDQQFRIMLGNEGRSLEDYKKAIRDQILVSRIVSMHVGKKSAIGKKQIKAYYIQHQKNYWEKPKVKARHILFIFGKDTSNKEINLKKNMAQKILYQIRSGSDFAELARKYSEDVSAHLGGDVGIIEQGMMVPEFEEAVFRLKVGEVSDVVKTRYGLHIIKCDEIFPGFSRPLSQVKDEIESHLRFQNEQKAYKKWVEGLKENAFIEMSLFKDRRDTFTDNDIALKTKTTSLAGDDFFNDNDSKKTVKSKRLRKPEKPSISQQKLAEDKSPWNYQLIVKKLKYFKRMRDSEKISELEYRKKKKELLQNF